jgi:O-antigen ligase
VPHLNAWAHFNQAHNHYLQVVAEGGLLLALPLAIGLAALAAAAGRALRADRTELFWVRAGAAASLAGVAAQSLWEVPLTMPANGVLAAVLTSVLLHDRGKREEKSEK